MITSSAINKLYKLHSTPPDSYDKLNLSRLDSVLADSHSISFSDTAITINTIDFDSPFHEIPIKNICGIEFFEKITAIITRNSIMFFDNTTGETNIHIRIEKLSFLEKFRAYIFP